MPVHALTSLDGEIVADLDPGVAPETAGPTRFAADVAADQLALVARATTYQLATFGARLGGAAAGVRPRLLDTDAETRDRWCVEVAPLARDGRFTPLERADPDGALRGRGVAVAAEAWLGSLEGRTVAVEAFDDVGHAVAREVVRRGGLVVAISTARGAIARSGGFAVDELADARADHGDAFVHQLGLDVHLPRELHELRVDVLVPGAHVGVLDAEVAGRVRAGVVVPGAAVPCTSAALAALRAAGIAVLPDVVTTGGAAVAHLAPPGLTPDEVARRVDREVAERIEAARLARMDPIRHATTLAETFLSTWLPEPHRPDGPAVAP